MVEIAAPEPLRRLIEDFEFVDRAERMDLLVEYADKFHEVPPEIAERPFPADNHVVRCESDAYVWAEDQPDGTLKYYFAVENPQGVSAKAWAAVMDETMSGQPLEEVAATDPEVVFKLFGRDISMGKGQGLMGMLDHVTSAARRKLNAARAASS